MKTRVLMMALMLTAAAAGAAQAQTIKVGVFDPVRVSEETAEGQKIAAQLKSLFEEKQAAIQALQQELVDLQQQAQTQALSLSEAKREELRRDIQRKSLDLTSLRDRSTRELELAQGDAESKFQGLLLRVVDEYGKREGFTLILDRGQVVWATQSIDVTTGIIDLFNQLVQGDDAGAQ